MEMQGIMTGKSCRNALFRALAAGIALLSWGTVCAQDGERYAVTALSVNYLREQPDFCAELGNQLLLGTPVEIIGEEGYWRRVKTPDPYTAWCVDAGLEEMSREELEGYIAAEKVICTADYSVVSERPGKTKYGAGNDDSGSCRKESSARKRRGCNPKICDLVTGDLLRCTGKSARGYVEVELPTGKRGFVPKKDVEPFKEWAEACDPSADNIIRCAMRFLGVPYFWGGTSVKGVDCSGLTKMVWYLNGILLPRNASQQARVGEKVDVDAGLEMTERIRNLRKGDLIFFGTPERKTAGEAESGQALQEGKGGETVIPARITHVGIYIGEGRFIHASKYVRINSLLPGEKDFYELSGNLIAARRITLPQDDEAEAGQGSAEEFFDGDGELSVMRITDCPVYFQ